MSNEIDLIYFLALTKYENIKAITVIDLQIGMRYERSDWEAVNEINYHVLANALEAAKDYSKSRLVPYMLFDSRYNRGSEGMPDNGINILTPEDLHFFDKFKGLVLGGAQQAQRLD